MKRLIAVSIIWLLVSCNNSNLEKETSKTTIQLKETKSGKAPEKIVLTKAEIKERTENVFQNFIYLYSELDEFKNNPSFKVNGFTKHFRKWLNNVDLFRKDPNSKLLISKGIIVADLSNLGLAYAGSKGNETEFTKSLNELLLNTIPDSSRPVYGEKKYLKLKSEGTRVDGKWIIKIAMFNNSGYAFEIYQKRNKYIGILPQAPFREMRLTKKGFIFTVVGDKYDDYKIITREEFDLKG